jgi:hypothetical protein
MRPVQIDRRQFLVLGSMACVSAPERAAGALFSPESFGARGDGATDDFAAFQRLAAAVSRAGGGTISLAGGRTYFLGRNVRAGNGVSDVIFSGCSGLAIEGNAATISVDGNFSRDVPSTRSLCGLRFEDCANLSIRNLELVGNVQLMSRTPGLSEAASHGLLFAGCSDVLVERVTCRHFASDGLYITASASAGRSGARRASRRFTVRNSRFLFNARQGLSVIQLRGGVFDNCDFAFSGYLDAQSSTGSYGAHSPAAGVDVEPNASPFTARAVDLMTGELDFTNCRMTGNYGATFLAGQYKDCARSLENVRLQSCRLSCNAQQTTGRYGFIFDVDGGLVANCTLDMYNKTAFIGWYPQSDADPTFRDNLVRGDAGANPLFSLRPTRGSPLIERNRFVAQPRPQSGRPNLPLARFDNPNATVRDNLFVLPALAGSPPVSTIVRLDVAAAQGNRYQLGAGGAAYPLPAANPAPASRRPNSRGEQCGPNAAKQD